MSVLAIFAHPGHELRVLGWCMRNRPTVVFLTNGQGSTDKGRLATSLGVLDEIGCRAHARSGSFSDREIYEAILADRPEPVASFFNAVLDEHGERLTRIVFDRPEGFNPAHDLVGVVGQQLAERFSSARGGASPAAWAVSLEASPADDRRHANSVELCRCTDDELRLKHDLARSYVELAPEVSEAMRQGGAESFRTEWGHRIDPGRSLEDSVPRKPAFERYGEERVRKGIYTNVLRRDVHLLPFLRHLLEQLKSRR